jgi:hypothetical protein
MPSTRFLCLAPFSPLDTYQTNLSTIAGYISSQAASNGFTYIANTKDFITGTGKIGTTTGVGNSDYYTLADGYHLTDDGYEYLGRRLASEIKVVARNWAATDRLYTMSASHAGIVPAPSASPSSTKYLTEAGTWAVATGGSGTTITAARAYLSGPATGLTGLVQFQFDAHDYIDVAGYHSTSVNPARFIAPATGRYRLTAQVALTDITAQGAIVGIDKNNSGNFYWQQLLATVPAGDLASQIVAQVTTGWLQLNANDYLAVSVYCGDADWGATENSTWAVFERAA